MHCDHCGKEIGINTNFCPYCGSEQKRYKSRNNIVKFLMRNRSYIIKMTDCITENLGALFVAAFTILYIMALLFFPYASDVEGHHHYLLIRFAGKIMKSESAGAYASVFILMMIGILIVSGITLAVIIRKFHRTWLPYLLLIVNYFLAFNLANLFQAFSFSTYQQSSGLMLLEMNAMMSMLVIYYGGISLFIRWMIRLIRSY